MDEKENFPKKFEETPWIYPLIDKGTKDITDIARAVAEDTGLPEESVVETFRLYNEVVREKLEEGYAVEYLGMGTLIPELDEDGNLVNISFEESKEFLKRLEEHFRSNPSLN